MSNLKHVNATIETAKQDRKNLILFFGNFANYEYLEDRASIERIEICDNFLTYPVCTSRGIELWQKRYPLQGLYVAIQTRSQRQLVDSKHTLIKAIVDVCKDSDSIGLSASTLETAFKYATPQMASNFTFNDGCAASFLPANKPLLFHESGEKFTANFQPMKIGKAIRQVCNTILGIGASDSQIEQMTNKIKSQFAPIEILTSDSVSEVYALNHGDSSETGTLADSCMKNKSYLYNDLDSSANCQVLYALNCDGELIARALLWEACDGSKVMDRIYGSDANIEKFKAYAKSQGYYCKARQSYSDINTFICPTTGETIEKYFTIDVEEIDENNAPFLDTFYYYGFDSDTENYIVSNMSSHFTSHTCRETNGEMAPY